MPRSHATRKGLKRIWTRVSPPCLRGSSHFRVQQEVPRSTSSPPPRFADQDTGNATSQQVPAHIQRGLIHEAREVEKSLQTRKLRPRKMQGTFESPSPFQTQVSNPICLTLRLWPVTASFAESLSGASRGDVCHPAPRSHSAWAALPRPDSRCLGPRATPTAPAHGRTRGAVLCSLRRRRTGALPRGCLVNYCPCGSMWTGLQGLQHQLAAHSPFLISSLQAAARAVPFLTR